MVQKTNAARAYVPASVEDAPAGLRQQRLASVEAALVSAVESPARRLQLDLEQSLARSEPRRWSARRSLAFIFCSSAILWTSVIWGVLRIL